MFFFSRAKKDQSNRRRAPRQKTRNLISIELPHRVILNMVNISETGLQFSSPVKLKHNQIITMDINLARQGAQIQALGRVVWAKRISDSTDKLYRVGIQFLELSKEAAAIIRLYVYSPLAA